MDYTLLGLSGLAVFVLTMVSGLIISLLSTQLQCSKISFLSSLKQGSISAVGPTIVYTLAAAFLFLRKPFSETFVSFGVPDETSRILGVGYLTMLVSWITMVWNVHNSEKAVCQTTAKEMTDFKKKLLAQLAEKEKQKEDHAKK
jgi:hypothetical protein